MNLSFKVEENRKPFYVIFSAITLASLTGLLFPIARFLNAGQPYRVLFILAKVGLTIIPPIAWLAAFFIIFLWVTVLLKIWRISPN